MLKKVKNEKKELKKTTIIKIACAIALAAVCVVAVLFFLLRDTYKPDSETLSIVNEAAVTTFNSEITDEYEKQGKEKIDKVKMYVFEFELKNGDRATFAFAEDLKETKNIYYKSEDEFIPVIFIDKNGNNELDNDAEWPDSWSK